MVPAGTRRAPFGAAGVPLEPSLGRTATGRSAVAREGQGWALWQVPEMPRFWHAATVKPSQERRAQRELEQQNFRTFMPRVRIRRHTSDGRPAYRIMPYLPGYILVRFDRERDAWASINGTRGVGHLIMCGDLPSRMRRGVVEKMIAAMGDDFAVDERKLDEAIIRTGDEISLGGAFEGKTVIVRSAHEKVRFMMEFFGRQVAVTASAGVVRKATA